MVKMPRKYTPEELMKLAIEASMNSIPEHADKEDPLVGAIVTTPDGEILAIAHRGELRVGEHCEYTLIERKLKDRNLKGCVLYVTLEPCVDGARRAPKRGCATHIVKSRIAKVYIGMRDPNPKIENEGANYLTSKGIEVIDFPAHLEKEIRESNAKFIAEKEAEQMLLKQEKEEQPLTYLAKPVSEVDISKFDTATVNRFLNDSGAKFTYPSADFNQWALEFKIVSKNEQGALHPTRLGLILFGKEVEKSYPHTIFKVEIDYGAGQTEIKDFAGPIVNQLPDIIDFVKDKGLKLTIDRSKGQRETASDFPLEVLREAIANAIIHRDYENEKSPNYLYISSDKIIVRSPGSPESPLTIADLKTFDTGSVSRNPKIMYVFNKMGLAEQRGIGLRNMKQLPQLGFPLPVFRLKTGMLEVLFGRNQDFIAEIQGIDSSQLNKEDKDALRFIQEKVAISAGEFGEHFHLEPKTANRRLKKLVDLGLVIQTGEKKGTKYHLK